MKKIRVKTEKEKPEKAMQKKTSIKKKTTGQKVQNKKEKKLRILILEDNLSDAELMERQLKKDGITFVSQRVENKSNYLKALKTFQPDLILADYQLPKFNALQALTLRSTMAPQTPFIIVTGTISEDVAVECIKQGADDYLLKDRLARLGEAVKHSIAKRGLQYEKALAEARLQASELLYRTFIDSSNDMAFLKDDKFRHLLANHELCRFYKKTEKEIIGKADAELMDKSSAARCRETDKQALAENKVQVSEETIGSLTFESRKFPVKLINGRIGVGGYIRDISESKHRHEQIEQASRKWTITFDAIKDGIALMTADQTIMQANQAFANLVNKPFKEIIGKKCYALIHPDQQPFHHCPFKKMNESNNRESMELALGDRIFDVIVDPIKQESGGIASAVHIFSDITERRQAENQLKDSLQEKEVLLKEIHHRVKNNLQIISGLLTLQSAQTNDKRLQQMVAESQGRIWTMALIHQTLYQTGNLADIDMADYIRGLVGNLLSAHAQIAMPPTIIFELLPLRLTIDKAIPLALIINELMTNAIKYAFPAGRPSEIRIALQERRGTAPGRGTARRAPLKNTETTPNEGTARLVPERGCAPTENTGTIHPDGENAPAYELTVSDNGVGLPVGFDLKNQKSLGLQLVTMLIKQLDGQLAIESRGGTSVRITFSDNEKK